MLFRMSSFSYFTQGFAAFETKIAILPLFLLQISKNLMARYGKEYHAACKGNTMGTVNDKVGRFILLMKQSLTTSFLNHNLCPNH